MPLDSVTRRASVCLNDLVDEYKNGVKKNLRVGRDVVDRTTLKTLNASGLTTPSLLETRVQRTSQSR